MIQDLLFLTNRRRSGKSHLLSEGIKNYDRPFMLVCRNIVDGKRLTNNNPNATYITPETAYKLKGSIQPVIFDQEVVIQYLEKILELESKLSVSKSFR